MTEPEDPTPTDAPADPPADDLDSFDDIDLGDEEQTMGMPRAKAVRIAQVCLVVLALLVVGVVLLTRGGDSSSDGSSKDDKTSTSDDGGDKGSSKPVFPAEIGGRPAGLGARGEKAPDVKVGEDTKPGVYLWSDYDGWHLWVVNGEGVPPVKGTITSNDDIAKATAAVPGAGTVKADGKVVTFDLPAQPGLVGVDFNPGFFAENLVFTLDGPDGPVPEDVVFLGSKSVQAPYPLVIAKSTS